MEAKLGDPPLEKFLLTHKYDEDAASSNISSPYDGPVVTVENDRAGFGFAGQLQKLPLRQDEFAEDEPRVLTWIDCQRGTVDNLREVSLDFEDVRILKITEADKPQTMIQFRILDTYRNTYGTQP